MDKVHSTCLICKSERLISLPNFPKANLVSCKNCQFVFAKGIPSKEELDANYANYSREDYISPITVKRYNELLDTLEPYRRTNRLIDVGCGVGHFLVVAKERGWEVHGTEYADDAMAICTAKGIDMKQGPFNINNYEKESFDIITSFEVIEHINNPIGEVMGFNQLLRKGGAAYVTTPNFNSLQRFYLKEKWSVIEYPEHLSYYTPKTISQLFKKLGFQKSWIQTTGISISRAKVAMKMSEERFNSATSSDEQVRQKVESSRFLQLAKSTVNGILTMTGTGDALKGLFEKE